MFKSLEFLVGQKVNIDEVVQTLVAFGYTRATKVFKEGEFALRGGVLDIYPANFEIPLRLDLDDDMFLPSMVLIPSVPRISMSTPSSWFYLSRLLPNLFFLPMSL